VSFLCSYRSLKRHAFGMLLFGLSFFLSGAAMAAAPLNLGSSAALVLDEQSGEVLFGKNAASVLPIASITKLMTAVVVLDAKLDPNEPVTITNDDVDWLRGSHSKLAVGVTLTRDEMLRLALMASENRAAYALSRYYPGGRPAFVEAMNHKAQMLGMHGTRYADPTGLSSTNVSTAEDLGKLVRAAHEYAEIRQYSTMTNFSVTANGRPLAFRNTNALVMSPDWEIGLSKTGFINEAGRCLVMQTKLAGRAVVIVLLDSWGRYTRTADAARIRKWMEVAAGYVSPKAVVSAAKAKIARPAARVKATLPVARAKSPRPVVHASTARPSL
jgi:D-alanyl-D-alanine endopeptidase (penicillin-binding protein 7)